MKELEKIKRLYLFVDTINAFCRVGAMSDSKVLETVPHLLTLINIALKDETGQIGFIKDWHTLGCREFDRYPVHSLANTIESEVIEELKPFVKEALIYKKNSTSAIFAKGFMEDIKRLRQLEEIVIAGWCTDICDMNLAIPLQNYFDETDKRVDIIIPKNAVDTFDAPNHQKEEYNEMAFKLMQQAGIKLVRKYERR